MSDELRALEDKVDSLSQRFEVHCAGEEGFRSLSLEKLETLKLALENSAMKASAEAAQRWELRISALEMAQKETDRVAQAHIKSCENENKQLHEGRVERQRAINNLWTAVTVTILGLIGQFIFLFVQIK